MALNLNAGTPQSKDVDNSKDSSKRPPHRDQSKEPNKLLSYHTFIQKKWAHFSEKHICALIPELKSPEIVNEMIDSGMFIELRRRFRKFMMISDEHPYTKMVFSSMTDLKNEKTRHLVKYYWMIHPFSKAALYFDFFMTAVYLYTLFFTIPLNLIYVRYYHSLKWHTFFLDMIVTGGMITTFFLGYLDKDRMHVEMKRRKIAKKYLSTYFFFDLISCFASYLLYFYLIARGPSRLNIVKYAMVGRLARFRTMDETLDIFRLYFGFSASIHVSIQIMLRVFLTIMFCLGLSAFLHQIPYLTEHITLPEDKAMSLDITFNTVAQMFGVGKVPDFDKYGESIQFVLFPTLAMLLHFWIIAKLYTLWQRILVSSQIGEDNVQQIGSYLEYKGLPLKTRDEIYCYFDFTYQKKFYSESNILNIMSENLRKEIPNYKLSKSAKNIQFLKQLPKNILMTVIAHMTLSYYCPGDVIFRAGTTGNTFYYIKFGTVALLDEKEVEICHLEDNSYYGDISVVFKQERHETMMAIAPCEICKLEQKVLINVLEVFPDLKEKVYEITRQLLLTRKQDWVSSRHTPKRSVSIKLDDAKN